VQAVLEILNEGLSFQEIIENYYSDLTVEDIQACLEYAIALVAADDVNVTLQLTEGVRLFVLEHDAQAAYDALAEAKLLPDTIAMDPEPEDEEGEEGEDS
jgi:hypothetical protein